MAQRQQVTWGELRVGIFVLLGLALLGVGIFYVTGSTLFGARVHPGDLSARGRRLNVGGPVSLDGVQVGNVEAITMAQPGPGVVPDPNRSVEDPDEGQRADTRTTSAPIPRPAWSRRDSSASAP